MSTESEEIKVSRTPRYCIAEIFTSLHGNQLASVRASHNTTLDLKSR